MVNVRPDTVENPDVLARAETAEKQKNDRIQAMLHQRRQQEFNLMQQH